jgi:hypothetical protein
VVAEAKRAWPPAAAVYELKSAQCVPPCALIDGWLLVATAAQVEVPETVVLVQPPLSKPSAKRFVPEPPPLPPPEPPPVPPPEPPPAPPVTVSATVAECVLVPSVPVTVKLCAPAATEDATEMLMVAPAPAETEVVERVAVTPVGTPESARLTVPEPTVAEVLTAEVPLEPAAMLVEELAMVKSGVVPQVGADQARQLLAEFENSSWIVYDCPSHAA